MFSFTRIRKNLYQYRGFDVGISFDEYTNTTMLAKTQTASGASVQFYAYGSDFERIKGIIIGKVDTYLQVRPFEATPNGYEGT